MNKILAFVGCFGVLITGGTSTQGFGVSTPCVRSNASMKIIACLIA